MPNLNLKSDHVITSYSPFSSGIIDPLMPSELKLALPVNVDTNPLNNSECSFGLS